ncbi:MAG: rod shape-determining protein MreD [Bacillota bacterium]|nr:rod shape-determining protein MreD [Bacillota bacterium]
MKARNIVFAVSIFIIVVLQTTVLHYIKIFGITPNIMVVVVIGIALLFGNTQGAIAGFILGFCQDITFGKMLGFYALAGLYLGLVVGIVNKRLYRENILVIIFFTFISTIVYELSVYLVHEWGMHLFSPENSNNLDILYAVRNITLPEAIYNSIISVPIYALMIRINDRFENANKSIRKY